MVPDDKKAPIPMTAAGFAAMKAELEELKAKRPMLVAELSNARSQGDLSENFGYQDARRQLGMLDGRIETLEDSLRRAQVITDAERNGSIGIGSKVVVRDEFGESSYEMVGPTEGDIGRGLLSVASPLGKALVARRQGDKV